MHTMTKLCLLLFALLLLLASCSTAPSSSSTKGTSHTTLSTNTGTMTYSASPQDVILRTFYGGGTMGTLEMSPDISIYGDGTYLLGPGIQMREGHMSTNALQQLLHELVDNDGLLGFHRQQFYDIPDQNMTLLQLNLNGKNYAWYYGQFGSLQESTQDMGEYHALGQALATITQSISGSTHSYTSTNVALLVHQDFSPDVTKKIPVWTLPDFTLDAVAMYECGITPPDQTGPNADTGCLSFTVPHYAYLLSPQQSQTIQAILKGQQVGVFFEQDTQNYYSVVLRPLLPDELLKQMLAMYGSAELNYVGIPLHSGSIPKPTPSASAGV
jgi:PBP1b-binding outer membrane lipoprotein LpoB